MFPIRPGGARVLAAAVAIVLVSAGCEEVTDFPEGGVQVRATHGLPGVRNETTDFTASVAVDNFSTRTLFLDEACNWVLEREEGGAWVPAYTAPCTPSPALTQVAPGTSYVFTLTAFVANRLDESAAPDGLYRVRLALEASYSAVRRQVVPEDQRTSNGFVVP